jgi:hypothetical protein
MRERSEPALERCIELTDRLRAAAEDGAFEALAAGLDERSALLAVLAQSGERLDAAHVAGLARATEAALAALERCRDAVAAELERLRAARQVVRRSQRERAPRLVSRRV